MYKQTDKAIEILNKRTSRRFNKLKNQIDGLDELNILDSVTICYEGLAADNEEVFMDLAQDVYGRTYTKFVTAHVPAEARAARKARTTKDGRLKYSWLDKRLDGYDPITRYVYRHEVERKKSRLAEAIIALGGLATAPALLEWEKAKRLWALMTAQYADAITDDAYTDGLIDCGVTRVKWVTAKDERVCSECSSRDGVIYDIDDIPEKPHWRCRCYWVPVFKD